jgi:hypothetical protein
MARASVPGAFSFTWRRPAPVRLDVRETTPHSWTVTIDEMDLDPPSPPPPIRLADPLDQPWFKAPHARLKEEIKEEELPQPPPPVPPPPIEEPVSMAAAPAKKRTHDEALPLEEEAPKPKRSRATARDVSEALMPVQDIEALRQRYTKGADKMNRHAPDDLVWLDTSIDPVTGVRRHDYHVKLEGVDTIVKWLSVSRVKEKFYGHFDSKALAEKLSGYTKKPAQFYLDQFAKAAEDGTAKHRSNEAFLAWEDPWPVGVDYPPTQGFLRALAAHPTYDVYRTEYSIIDFFMKMVGQLDLLLRCRVTGKIKLVDFKHFAKDPTIVYPEDDTGLPERGCHPLTWHKPKSKLMETELQLNFYRFIMEEPRNNYGITIDEMCVWWFNPNKGHELDFQEFVIERIDVPAYYAALVDPAPVPPPPPRPMSVVVEEPMPPGALDPSIPRPVPGPTTIVHVTNERLQLDPDAVWVGKKWASKSGEWALSESIFKDPKSAFKRDKTPQELRAYERHLLTTPGLIEALSTLLCKTLMCWCDEGKCGCHAQVLRDYANALGAAAHETPLV